MGEEADLSTLIERIACLGRLREHLLWEAAKAMALDRSSSPGRRFAHMVEAGAMLDQTRPRHRKHRDTRWKLDLHRRKPADSRRQDDRRQDKANIPGRTC